MSCASAIAASTATLSGVKTWEVWRRGRAAAVLPYDPVADAVVLIEQFRLPALAAGLDPVLVELPAGLCDDGETPEATARRETMEEMGLAVGALRADRRLPADAGRVATRCATLSPAACRRRRPMRDGIAGHAGMAERARGHPRAGLAGGRARSTAALAGQMPNSVTTHRLALARRPPRRPCGRNGWRHDRTALSRRPRLRSRDRARCWRADRTGVVLDRTVFYARSGGQPGDVGVLRWDGGETRDRRHGEGRRRDDPALPAPDAALPPVGATVEGELDWDRRYRLMRMHTAMHLLCSLIKGAAVTGGQIGADRSRLDFDLPHAAGQGGARGRAERADRGGPSGARSNGWTRRCWTPIPAWCARSRCKPPRGAGPAAAGAHRRGRRRRWTCSRAAARMCARTGEIGRDRGGEDREQGQAEPAHHHRAGAGE